MFSKKNLPILLAATGAFVNIADAFTAEGDPGKGFFYGSSGVLRPLNQYLPINLGLLLILSGLALWLWRKYA